MRQHMSAATLAMAAAVALAACGGGKPAAQHNRTPNVGTAIGPAMQPTPTAESAGVRIARIVQPDTIVGTDGRVCIYSGMADDKHNMKSLMDFSTGDTMPALCAR